MSEETPKFERPPVKTYGSAPEELKELISEAIPVIFADEKINDIPDVLMQEVENTREKMDSRTEKIVALANDITNELLEKYGAQPFDIGPKQIFILPPEILTKIIGRNLEFKNGMSSPINQKIFINATEAKLSPIISARIIFHEMLHLKGFTSLQADIVTDKEGKRNIKINSRRFGISMLKKQKGENRKNEKIFLGLEEAIVTKMEESSSSKLFGNLNDEEINDQLNIFNSDKGKEMKKLMGEMWGCNPDDIYYWLHNEENNNIVIRANGYSKQMAVLDFMILEISKEENKSKEEILDLFVSAHFTGNILPIARLTEKYFGRGAFETLGNMNGEATSADKTLDYLKEQRQLMLSQKNRNNDEENKN